MTLLTEVITKSAGRPIDRPNLLSDGVMVSEEKDRSRVVRVAGRSYSDGAMALFGTLKRELTAAGIEWQEYRPDFPPTLVVLTFNMPD